MSGGYFNYENDSLCDMICHEYPNYGLDREYHKESAKNVRAYNPFEDKIISELIFDVFCLMHSYDWYKSGDTGPDDYEKDVKIFKNKWLKNLKDNKEFLRQYVDEEISHLKNELEKDLNF